MRRIVIIIIASLLVNIVGYSQPSKDNSLKAQQQTATVAQEPAKLVSKKDTLPEKTKKLDSLQSSAIPAKIKPIMRGMPIKLEAGKPMRYWPILPPRAE